MKTSGIISYEDDASIHIEKVNTNRIGVGRLVDIEFVPEDINPKLRGLWKTFCQFVSRETGYSEKEVDTMLKHNAGYEEYIEGLGGETFIVMRSTRNGDCTDMELSTLFEKSFAYIYHAGIDTIWFEKEYRRRTGQSFVLKRRLS